MAAVDPTYPLYPISCFLAVAMLLLVLWNGFLRQSWNFSVVLLCIWLLFENLTYGINAIIWADNIDIKHYVYCDIITHVQIVTLIGKPLATLFITRRLYLITSLRSAVAPNASANRRDLAVEWTISLVAPLLFAGPFYYIVQPYRFVIQEGFGCVSCVDASILTWLLQYFWVLVPSLVSILFYCPKVIWVLYRHQRELDRFLRSNDSVTRTNYYRMLALASIDVLLTLPIGIVVSVVPVIATFRRGGYPFYRGFTFLHTNWGPVAASYSDVDDPVDLAQIYFNQWISPALAFVMFGLFGITEEARESIRLAIQTVRARSGWKPAAARSPLGTIEFGERPQVSWPSVDPETGVRPDLEDSMHKQENEGEGEQTDRGSQGVLNEKVVDSS
ncbi:unnamed protein product [Peniophora sp. CBMAI 1063]|nr:unnamed protein product [Peniophora sp. CBMAI 1063]